MGRSLDESYYRAVRAQLEQNPLWRRLWEDQEAANLFGGPRGGSMAEPSDVISRPGSQDFTKTEDPVDSFISRRIAKREEAARVMDSIQPVTDSLGDEKLGQAIERTREIADSLPRGNGRKLIAIK